MKAFWLWKCRDVAACLKEQEEMRVRWLEMVDAKEGRIVGGREQHRQLAYKLTNVLTYRMLQKPFGSFRSLLPKFYLRGASHAQGTYRFYHHLYILLLLH